MKIKLDMECMDCGNTETIEIEGNSFILLHLEEVKAECPNCHMLELKMTRMTRIRRNDGG